MLTGVELQILEAVVSTAVTTVAGFTSRWLHHKGIAQKIQNIQVFDETHKSLARTAVLFAQQAYVDFSGTQKKNIALEFLASELNRLNIPVAQQQLEVLVETAVKSAKLEFGNMWNEIATQTPAIQPPQASAIEAGAKIPQTGQPISK